ncbi:MAG: lysophospholipid acyltransferase family protein [Myxococcota bacterium]|nr:lysophospholipid acyltransferase family protein [Myxococcota bacterium]
MSARALVALPSEDPEEEESSEGFFESLQAEIDARLARVPTPVNEYGVDPFGASPAVLRRTAIPFVLAYRYWFRCQTVGLQHLPEGPLLLIANHAGNTFAWDAAMLGTAMMLEAEPPRIARGMAEYYLPSIPWFGTLMHRGGSVVGRPENCQQLLEQGEAIMVFPEGARGFVKPFSQRYQLQRFGYGFARLALENRVPIVPVGIVGGEEHNPGFGGSRWLGKLIGAPVFPLTFGFPWLGMLGALPLPVQFRLHFGEPLWLDGDANDEDAKVEEQVERVRDAIRDLIAEGLAAREGVFG